MSNNIYDGIYYQKFFIDGKIIFLLKTNYANGKLNGTFEVYKYKNNIQFYSEKSTYVDGLLEGSELIKQTISGHELSSFYFYKTGLKHGPFKLITRTEIKEGNYKNGKLDGFIITTVIETSESSTSVYQDGNIVS